MDNWQQEEQERQIYMLNQKEFFREYKVKEAFEQSGLSWKLLDNIYIDYKNRIPKLDEKAKELVEIIRREKTFQIHSINYRCKNPFHLIEKIIRKCGIEHKHKYKDIDQNNYFRIIKDLIGIRILILSKEEWLQVYQHIMDLCDRNIGIKLDENEPNNPLAYVRYGDRDVFGNQIHKEYTNKGYRSQHYIIKYKGYYCEIQVRTLAEEVYGEFDHFVKYPYRDNNRFLKRYTNIVSEMLDSIDEIISTCFQFGDKGWEINEMYFGDDCYDDWQRTDQKSINTQERKILVCSENGKIDAKKYMNDFLLRREK